VTAIGETVKMHEQILPDLFRIEIPLPNSALKSLNAYLITGGDRSLIIDTGMNDKKCLEPMLSSLEALKVDLNQTDFFVTHLHADHIGLVGELSRETSKIYLSGVEASIINSSIDAPDDRIKKFFHSYVSNGFPEDEIRKAFSKHPANRYIPKEPINVSVPKENQTIDIGDYSFECIKTPGHSPGHTCLYESRKKILFSGDHILFDITPNITWWPEFENALEVYLESLRKVSTLDVSLVLPGHRNISEDHNKRIAELQDHHEFRLNEVVATLEKGEMTASDIASHLTWDIDVSSWELFPFIQKWFALGETIAHVIYLVSEGRVKAKTKDDRILYSL
jgi:glyoxylase-like metal-dependent hydrolase (beta-lactamase superfamily II)